MDNQFTPVLAETPVDPNVQAIQNNMAIILKLPQILTSHQLRTSKALDMGQQILKEITEWEEAGNKMTDAQFETAKAYIIKCREVLLELQNDRKPGTQSFDIIRGMFTALEKLIDITEKDTPAFKLQQKNNSFVQWQAEEKRKADEERERIAKKNQEVVSIRANFQSQIAQCLINFLSQKKTNIQGEFNKITLDTFDQKEKGLRGMDCTFPMEIISEHVKITSPHSIYHDKDEVNVFWQEEWATYPIMEFVNDYKTQILDLKNSLISQLPAKRDELEKIAAAGKKEKERLLLLQKEREAEAERLRLADIEKQKQIAIDAVKQKETAANIQTLFDATPVVSGPAAPVKVSVKITPNNHAGVVEIFTLWFQIFAAGLTVNDLLGKKISSMITELEREANKPGGGRRIAGTNVTYSVETKSQNRKVTEPKGS